MRFLKFNTMTTEHTNAPFDVDLMGTTSETFLNLPNTYPVEGFNLSSICEGKKHEYEVKYEGCQVSHSQYQDEEGCWFIDVNFDLIWGVRMGGFIELIIEGVAARVSWQPLGTESLGPLLVYKMTDLGGDEAYLSLYWMEEDLTLEERQQAVTQEVIWEEINKCQDPKLKDHLFRLLANTQEEEQEEQGH